jgi:acyl-coenzyme A synthetase/AMP-(fatty) acid ligase/3-hydroxymyristoyl/3-hydroxydecanoyl-(acyl carrier protein) dehydratase
MLSRLLHPDDDAHRALIAQAHRIAALLGSPGDRVVLSCRHAGAYVPALLGAWTAGATVELLPNVQPGTLDRVDADTGIAHVLHDDAARRERSPKAVYVPDVVAAVPPATETTATGPAPAPAPRSTAWPEIAVRMTTSGTTERPRTVAKAMSQLLDELDALARAIPSARCVMSTVPLSHLYGLLFGALLPLRFGARIVSHGALLPADVAAVIEREGVDLLISTPAHLRAMSDISLSDRAMPRGLRVISSGATMSPELHVRLASAHGWQITDVLGTTETGGIATRQDPTSPWAPLPGVVVSAPDGRLVVTSPWCDPAGVQVDDRALVRPDGSFEHLGRSHELVKIAGKRAHAHELEATVLAVPGVTDAAVLVHAAAGHEARVAMAVAADGAVGRGAVADAIRRQFDAVFVPRMIRVVARIPRTDRGKVDREALRALFGIDATELLNDGTSDATTAEIPAQRVGPGQYTAVIPHDLVFFRGHFDGFTILPGAVIVERLVWPIVKTELPDVGELRGIRRLRFRRPVLPEQRLSITVHRMASRTSGQREARLDFEVTCASTVVASGQLLVDGADER